MGFSSNPLQSKATAATESQVLAPNCRFGITSPHSLAGYDVSSLGVGNYLDWLAGASPALPTGVAYIRVLSVGNAAYSGTRQRIETGVPAHPGSFWVVGNEPDTTYVSQNGLPQDNLYAEIYAERFYTLATRIKQLDPTARVGFGTVVQPTPIRLRYLDKAWNKLVLLAGSATAASALIDFWNIHSFILNELPGEWGTGVPPGFENDNADAISITELTDTYSSELYASRITAFRLWMKNKGERNKPLWVTEYGSLLPPVDPPNGPDWENVSDEDTRNFMLATFDFMKSAANGITGYPEDNYRLVQRWFWYSLNDYRYLFGGALYDPDKTPPQRTIVGNSYAGYVSTIAVGPDFHITDKIQLHPEDLNANLWRLDFGLANAGTGERPQGVKISLYEGIRPGGTLLGSIDAGVVPGCGEVLPVSMNFNYPPTGSYGNIYLHIDTTNDLNPNDNDKVIPIPPRPSNLKAVPISQVRINLSWNDNSSNEYGFKIDHTLSGQDTWSQAGIVGMNVVMFSDAKLNCNTLYDFRVRVFNDVEWGYSGIATARTKNCAPPPKPIGLQALPLADRIYLSWIDQDDETGYEIWRSPDGINDWQMVGAVDRDVTGYWDYGLPKMTTFFYRIRATNDAGVSPDSEVVSAKTLFYSIFFPFVPYD